MPRASLLVAVLLAASAAPGSSAAAPCAADRLSDLRTRVETLGCQCSLATDPKIFFACVKRFANSAPDLKGATNRACKRALLRAEKKSICGRHGSVVCCRPGKPGKITPNKMTCVDAKKHPGTACASFAAAPFEVFPVSVADCSADGSCPSVPTTTTTLP